MQTPKTKTPQTREDASAPQQMAQTSIGILETDIEVMDCVNVTCKRLRKTNDATPSIWAIAWRTVCAFVRIDTGTRELKSRKAVICEAK